MELNSPTYPETLKHLLAVNTELLGVLGGELVEGESPAMETRAESDGTAVRIDLDITEVLVKVGGDDDVDGLDCAGEGLVQVFLGGLQLEQGAVDLVDDQDRLDTLGQSLAQDSLGLDADARHTVDNDQSTVGNAESGGDLGREVDVTGRVDQVDNELGPIDFLWDLLEVVLVRHLGVQGDGRRLDGNAAVLFIGAGVHEASLTGLGSGDDTSTLDQGVTESGLAVIDCRPS